MTMDAKQVVNIIGIVVSKKENLLPENEDHYVKTLKVETASATGGFSSVDSGKVYHTGMLHTPSGYKPNEVIMFDTPVSA
jgi:hypothetical protein